MMNISTFGIKYRNLYNCSGLASRYVKQTGYICGFLPRRNDIGETDMRDVADMAVLVLAEATRAQLIMWRGHL